MRAAIARFTSHEWDFGEYRLRPCSVEAAYRASRSPRQRRSMLTPDVPISIKRAKSFCSCVARPCPRARRCHSQMRPPLTGEFESDAFRRRLSQGAGSSVIADAAPGRQDASVLSRFARPGLTMNSSYISPSPRLLRSPPREYATFYFQPSSPISAFALRQRRFMAAADVAHIDDARALR